MMVNQGFLLFPAVFQFLFFSLPIESKEENMIYVNTTGSDKNSCVMEDNPCATINEALDRMKNFTSAVIYIAPGNYTLEHGEINHIDGKDYVAIIGSGETETIINCNSFAGLYITNTANVTIEYISFHGCSYRDKIPIISTIESKRYYNGLPKNQLQVSAAIGLVDCNASFHHVTIQHSKGGAGLLFLPHDCNDYLESVNISNCLIAGGHGELEMLMSEHRFVVGGGIVVIGSFPCFFSPRYSINKLFSITNSTITNNNYTVMKHYVDDTGCISLSGGAALTFINAPPQFIVDSCVITGNYRGLFIYSNIPSWICDQYEIANTIFNNFNNEIVYADCDSDISLELTNVTMFEPITYGAGNGAELPYFDDTPAFIMSRKELGSINNIYKVRIKEAICRPFDVSLTIGNYASSGLCPPSYSVCHGHKFNCSCYDNHNGTLCGQCIEGHSVAINSPYLSCVPCNDTMTVIKGWGLLIALEFIPVTVMVAVIVLLNVNLNQGSLKAYIFFCQMLTIPFPSVSYPSWFVVGYNYDRRFIDLSLLPFSIWNLGFINYPSCNLYDSSNHCNSMSICISTNTTPLGAIVFWYVIAFYPLLLLALSYVFMLMYYNGNRCVVCVIRPIHRLLARFWRMFNIQPSLTHTIASVYTLCFTQLAATSLKLLTPTQYIIDDDDIWFIQEYIETLFFYDGSVRYFHGWHGAAGTLALIVLIVFIILPIVYLFVYPFKCFQNCFNKLKFKKDLLVSVTDVFIGPYKDGTSGSWDYRCLAGLHFLLMFNALICLAFPSIASFATFPVNTGLCVFQIIILLVFRPYKKDVHTFTEVLVLISLVVFISPSMVAVYTSADKSVSSISITSIEVMIGFLYTAMVPAYLYAHYWLLLKFKYCVRQRRLLRRRVNVNLVQDGPINRVAHDDDGLFADRLVNPGDYEDRDNETQPLLEGCSMSH